MFQYIKYFFKKLTFYRKYWAIFAISICIFVFLFIKHFNDLVSFTLLLIIFLIQYIYSTLLETQIDNYEQQIQSFNFILDQLPFLIVLFEDDRVIYLNETVALLCKNPKNLDDFILNFNDYPELIEEIKNSFQNQNVRKDVMVLSRHWRIYNKHHENLNLICMLDISSQANHLEFEQILLKYLEFLPFGVIIGKQQQNSNVIMYTNHITNKITQMNLIGKNTQNFKFLDVVKSNRTQTMASNLGTINICLKQIENFVFYKLELEDDKLDSLIDEAPFRVILLDDDNKVLNKNQLAKDFKNNFIDFIKEHQKNYLIGYLKQVRMNKILNPILLEMDKDNVRFFMYAKLHKRKVIVFLLGNSFITDFYYFSHRQRLNSLGEIVGSISHDFSNSITAIVGLLDLFLNNYQITSHNKMYIDIMRIKHSASRAANLSKKMTRIASNNIANEQVIDVNEVMNEADATIFRVISGDNITININRGKNKPYVFMQETAFEQILINLTLNARDAMPYGGVINISSDTVKIDSPIIDNGYYINPGTYVELIVSDTGVGIPAQNLTKIFEPFFTTKEQNGSGFGLYTINSIVRQKGGFIKLTSKLNQGTIFKVYLPYKEPEIIVQNIENTDINKKRILFVEDEQLILAFAVEGLKNKGYEIFEEKDVEKALQFNQTIDLLITDLSMPKVNGIQLFQHLRSKIPNLKVLFISGYINEEITKLTDESTIFFLEKPFSFIELCHKIKIIFNYT